MVHPYDNFERLTCQAQVADQRDDYYAFDQTVFFRRQGGPISRPRDDQRPGSGGPQVGG